MFLIRYPAKLITFKFAVSVPAPLPCGIWFLFCKLHLMVYLAFTQYVLFKWTLVQWTLSWLVALLWYAVGMFPVWSFANLSCVVPHCPVSFYTFTILLFLIQSLDFDLFLRLEVFNVIWLLPVTVCSLVVQSLWVCFLGLSSIGGLCSSCTATVTFIFNLESFSLNK